MIEVIWQFIVKEEARGRFELAFGPGGAWSNLVGRSPGFRGTTLLHDTRNPKRYLMVDVWDADARRAQLLAEGQAEYAQLGSIFGEWAESETHLGLFTALAQATVRPPPRSARAKSGGAGRKRQPRSP